jgi:hypothetical protein
MWAGVWLLRFVTLLGAVATTPLQNAISAFLEDLVRVQEWRKMTLLHCPGE